MIRSATADDAAAIAAIYNHYVLHTHITFEEEPVAPEQVRVRMAQIQSTHPWLVHEQGGSIDGYAYAHKWHTRRSYSRSVETTVYLDKAKHGRGIGSELYEELIRALKSAGMHVAVGAISLPNEGSVALHEKLGFAQVGHFREMGWKLERWVDVGYWQLML